VIAKKEYVRMIRDQIAPLLAAALGRDAVSRCMPKSPDENAATDRAAAGSGGGPRCIQVDVDCDGEDRHRARD